MYTISIWQYSKFNFNGIKLNIIPKWKNSSFLSLKVVSERSKNRKCERKGKQIEEIERKNNLFDVLAIVYGHGDTFSILFLLYK